MKAIKGAYLMAFVKVADAVKAIAMAKSHTLKVSTDTKETTSKDSGGKFQEVEAGITSWEATSENAYTLQGDENPGLTYDDLLDLQLAQTPVTLVLGMASQHQGATPVDNVPSSGWTPGTGCRTGEAIITSLELNMPNNDKASFTVTFTGTGPLTKYTPAS